MFDAIETDQKLSKSDYEAQLLDLRVGLINAQYDLRHADFPVIIVISGNDRLGCNALLHTLHDVMDARYMRTNALGEPTEEELERPRFWRYWTTLPRQGRIGIFLGGWPLNAISDRVHQRLDDEGLSRRIDYIKSFEHELVTDGAVLLKFWLHLPKKALKKRLKAASKNPKRAWQIGDADWQIYKQYNNAIRVAEQVVSDTHTDDSPWHLIDSTDTEHRDLTASTTILQTLTARLKAAAQAPKPRRRRRVAPKPSATAPPMLLDTVDLTQTLPREDYRERLQSYQARLHRLTQKAQKHGLSCVWVFEGWDAAGKGGVIRRLTAAMDPEHYQLHPIAAPTAEEKSYHYLWRFWRRLPRAGNVAIFDRSWYGRVLVERIERFASDPEWQRAYQEINDFEAQLYDSGILLLKFWLHVDPDEQLRRFQEREATPYKKYKITAEDYRNRDQWTAYEQAVHEMVTQTDHACAPWRLVASNDKRWARVDVLKAVCDGVQAYL